VIDIVLTGYMGFIGGKLKTAREKNNLATHLWDPRRASCAEFIKSKPKGFEKLDVVHLAGDTNVVGSWENPERTIANNLKCLLEVLKFCRHTNSRLTIASTALKENLQAHAWRRENTPVMSPYHLSKSIGEELCRYYSAQYKISCRNLRVFSVYGASQPESSLIPTIFRQVASNSKEIRVQTIDVVRDFIHVDDVLSAIQCTFETDATGFNSYEIGTGQGTSIKDLIKLIQSIAKTDKQVVVVGGIREMDQKSVVAGKNQPDVLKWHARVSLHDGLEGLLGRGVG
jgi:nucleoside-diphosphate-sugar epimerase